MAGCAGSNVEFFQGPGLGLYERRDTAQMVPEIIQLIVEWGDVDFESFEPGFETKKELG
jgi:hypothetical protein